MFGDDLQDETAPGQLRRVLICDEHDLVRRALTASLEEDPSIEVVEETATGAQAVTDCLHVAPDLVIVSLVLPDRSGVDTVHLVAEVMPRTLVVALAVEETVDERFSALRAGACAVVDKDTFLAETDVVVDGVLRGVPLTDPDMAAALLERFDETVAEVQAAPLSARERDVLEHLVEAEGVVTAETVAEALGLAPGEPRNHVLNVLFRLHLAGAGEPDADGRALLSSIGP